QQAEEAWRRGGAFIPVENPTIKELLNRAAEELTKEKIEQKFPGQPRVQAVILRTVGDTYLGIGEYARAIDHLERANALCAAHQDPDKQLMSAIMNNQAIAYEAVGRVTEAIRLFERARDMRIATKGPDHGDTLINMHNLARAYRAA